MREPLPATSPLDVISRAILKIHLLKNMVITDEIGGGCMLSERESSGLFFSFLSIAEELEAALQQLEAPH